MSDEHRVDPDNPLSANARDLLHDTRAWTVAALVAAIAILRRLRR